MSQSVIDNKRIAKNTITLYIRMLFLMCISFYTSRILLKTLGIDDFGVYNVVGGVVVLFAFVNSAMTTGTQRHLSYELGLKDSNIARIFSACLNIHLLLAILTVVLAETIGLWFVNTQLNYPEGRLYAVNWVYQMSVLSCVLSVIRVPYNATIVAYEKMTFYAYMGILEGLMKLAIIYMLTMGNYDKLILYSILVSLVTFTINIIYYVFCKIIISSIKYESVKETPLYKKLLSFSGWTLFGSLANLGRHQILSFIINIFYGVTLNAAIGIANQVNAGISQFVLGFQTAFNPQLTKSEAATEKKSQFDLINKTAKYSYFLVLIFAVPILYNIEYILKIWLGDFPAYSCELCFWIVVANIVDAISGPLWTTIFATGKIKSYQIVISIVLLLCLPLAYMFGQFNFEPQYTFAGLAFVNLVATYVRLIYLKKMKGFDVMNFLKSVIYPIIIVTTIIILICAICKHLLIPANSIILLLFQTLGLFAITLLCIWFVALSKQEQNILIKNIKRVL